MIWFVCTWNKLLSNLSINGIYMADSTIRCLKLAVNKQQIWPIHILRIPHFSVCYKCIFIRVCFLHPTNLSSVTECLTFLSRVYMNRMLRSTTFRTVITRIKYKILLWPYGKLLTLRSNYVQYRTVPTNVVASNATNNSSTKMNKLINIVRLHWGNVWGSEIDNRIFPTGTM